MKAYYRIEHTICDNNDEYLLYKGYEDEIGKYSTPCGLIRGYNSKAELCIHLSLLGMNFEKDFKQIDDIKNEKKKIDL